jgi:uncharacterized protein
MAATYLDASAIVKLVIAEPESSALRKFLRRRRTLISSALSRTEVIRAVLGQGEPGIVRARSVLSRLDVVRVNDRVLEAAGELLPAELRSLDAVHLATARLLGSDLGYVVAYDDRMLHAARLLDLATAAPA